MPSEIPHAVDHGEDRAPTAYELLETAVRELLIEKGVLTADEVRGAIEAMEARGPAQGSFIVARAWTDAGYRERLLADGGAAALPSMWRLRCRSGICCSTRWKSTKSSAANTSGATSIARTTYPASPT